MDKNRKVYVCLFLSDWFELQMSDTYGEKENVCGKKTIIYTTESPLMCMAVSSKAEMVAVAGRNLFQVFSVHEDKFISVRFFRLQ